jgi:hypothetical protein
MLDIINGENISTESEKCQKNKKKGKRKKFAIILLARVPNTTSVTYSVAAR